MSNLIKIKVLNNTCDGCCFVGYKGRCLRGPELSTDCLEDSYIWKRDEKQDIIVEELRTMLLQRSQTGINKYGTTLDRTDLKPSEWCQHALEETLDFAGYILRLKKDLEKIEKLAKGELGEN